MHFNLLGIETTTTATTTTPNKFHQSVNYFYSIYSTHTHTYIVTPLYPIYMLRVFVWWLLFPICLFVRFVLSFCIHFCVSIIVTAFVCTFLFNCLLFVVCPLMVFFRPLSLLLSPSPSLILLCTAHVSRSPKVIFIKKHPYTSNQIEVNSIWCREKFRKIETKSKKRHRNNELALGPS